MTDYRFVAEDEEGTDRLGRIVAEALPAGSVVALIGTLGAGKTRFVQSVAEAVGVPREDVTSPTFVIVREYIQGRKPIYHFDAYRLKDEDEFLELGPEEYFDSEGITFVEWADRVERCLPADYLTIAIEVLSETNRQFTFSSSSVEYQFLIERIAVQCKLLENKLA